ncbi:MAG: CRISPR-associated endoribonuclease Cas6, partial [Ignavibacteria bacterium]|nr:CRISPR-associated endoribonuclease Cas6 [Ignavibacteria bacterium]
MRFKLTLKQNKENQLIPFNYQYYLSCFIYKTIARANSDYAEWLHDQAFSSGYKKFKLFSFSRLNIPQFECEGMYIKILSPYLYLIITMLVDEIAENIVLGLFQNQQMFINNGDELAIFRIKYVERLPDPQFTETMHFKTLSPILIKKKEKINGVDKVIFLRPDDEDYFQYLKTNLEEKYITFAQKNNTKIPERSLDSFKLLDRYKPDLITIKEGNQNEVKLKAYNMTFELTGSPEMMRIGYEAGFGVNNSLGLGCV